jgi:HlyD family secretion protein
VVLSVLLSVEVKLTVPNPPDHLRQDMTVSVDIEVARWSGTLSLPARVIHESRTNSPWVLTIVSGRAHKQTVQLGLRANNEIEILDGVNEGGKVIPVTAGLKPGQRVRPIEP